MPTRIPPSRGRRPAPVTIDAPAANQSVTGVVVLKGRLSQHKTVTAVDVAYDSAAYRPATWRPGGKTWRTLFNTVAIGTGAHVLRVRVTYADASTDVSSTPVTVGSSTMRSGVSALKLGSGFPGLATNKDKYATFQINEGDAGALADVITRGTLALTWMYGTTVQKANPDGHSLGVSYNECVAKGWIQKTAGNADVEYPGDPNQIFVKFGDPNYIARVVDRFVNDPNTIADDHGAFLQGVFAANAGISGAMCDDTNASASASGTTPSATYPSSVAWRDAMFDFLKGVGTGLQDAGYAFGCNPNSSSNEFVSASSGPKYSWGAWGQAHDGDQLGHWLQAMAPYVDVAMVEYWMAGGSGAGYRDSVKVLGASANQAYREYQTNVMPRTNAAGMCLLCNLQVGMTADNGSDDTNLSSAYNQARMIYLRASFLLNYDPTTGTSADLSVPPGGYSSLTDPWNASWTKDMGLPLGAMTEPVSGGFLRRFANGDVFLNANGGSSVTFPAPDNLLVAAKTAVIT